MTATKDKQGTPRRAEEMFPLMEQFEASGQTQQAFRQAHGFSRSGFQYWLRRYRQSKQSQAPGSRAFIPLKITKGAMPSANRFRGPKGEAASVPEVVILFSDGTRVEARGQVEASFVRQILGR